MEINVRSAPIQPEVPKILDNEQINVYVPFATTLYAGIASYDSKHFEFKLPGKVSVHHDITETLNYVRRTLDPTLDNNALYKVGNEYGNSLLRTAAKTVIPAINEHDEKIGNGSILAPVPGYDDDGKETGLIGLANSTKRWLHYFINTTYRIHVEESDAHFKQLDDHIVRIDGVLNEHGREITLLKGRVTDIEDKIGYEELGTSEQTLIGGINEVDHKTKVNARDIVNLNSQILGIGKTYVVQTFPDFILFINGELKVTNYEDHDGDGVAEPYEIGIADLKTGDNILIAETYVPDFWFEKTTSIANAGEYTYTDKDGKETTYDLIGKIGDTIYGLLHQLEARYIIGDVLPVVTEADEGKFLRVINGDWNVAEVLNAEEAKF